MSKFDNISKGRNLFITGTTRECWLAFDHPINLDVEISEVHDFYVDTKHENVDKNVILTFRQILSALFRHDRYRLMPS